MKQEIPGVGGLRAVCVYVVIVVLSNVAEKLQTLSPFWYSKNKCITVERIRKFLTQNTRLKRTKRIYKSRIK